MLSITSNAAQVVSSIRQEQGVPDGFGLRVYAQQGTEGTAVQLAFTKEPSEGDQIGDSEGVKLFVAPELTEPLSDSVIDVEKTPDGAAGLVLKQTPQG